MKSLWRGRTLLMLMLASWLLVLQLGGAGVAAAQVQTSQVSDTVYRADGTPAGGTVVIRWSAFTTANGDSVPAGSTTVTLGTGGALNGALNVALAPNAGSTPMGSYYTAVYHLNDGTTSKEYWVVPVVPPGGTPVKLAAIRNQVLPMSVAMQTVSKQYVDSQISRAVSAVFGPSGTTHSVGAVPDPGTVAGDTRYLREDGTWDVPPSSGGGGGGSPTGSASGDLSGSYPSPTVAAVHATSGTLDGVTIGGTTPAAAAFTTAGTTGTLSLAVSSGNVPTALLRFGLGNLPVISATPCCGGSSVLEWGNPFLSGNFWNAGVSIGSYGSPYAAPANGLAVGSTGQFQVDSTGHVTAPAFHEVLTTPASSSAACSAGDFTDDANFHYVCVATNTWKRAVLSTF